MQILVFDNYDSFTYNLVHLVEKIIREQVTVVRNDQVDLDTVENFDKIILSPGPGVPSEAGQLLPLIRRFAPQKSILGVCLGHQAIAEAFGGSLTNLTQVFHGVATPIRICQAATAAQAAHNIFRDMPNGITVGRYHSWVVTEADLPESLEITARDEHQYIMGLKHKTYDVQGVQFHPESVLTPDGERMLRNWLGVSRR
ncbi:MAG: aminodeoxychorismate/anthranilate synthase component II [Chitinophagaceae bacterium]|nr:aminodeoxychorismate/anthranilate synthase component II [Chitinophagaceae bacterium]